ncbi:MAG: NAD(P)-dependent oxidoreductase [Rhodospirillales bacterium]
MEPFRLGFTHDCLRPDGEPAFDPAALEPLKRAAPGVAFEFIDAATPAVTPDQARRYDAIVTMRPRTEAASLARADRRLRLVARFGVGFDNVDVDACTRAGVIVANTPEAVRRPVATVILGFVMALSLKLFRLDRLTRAGRWAERHDDMGVGLVGKTFGAFGVGSIGKEAFRLLRPLGMRHLGCDPYAEPEGMNELGVRLVDKDTLLREADFVSVSTPLTPETARLIDARALSLMKPTAFLINTSRGQTVDEKALHAALKERRIAGAALDVFEQEPVAPDNPILKLDNVIVTPHSLCHTDECFREIAASAIGAALSLARGEAPRFTVNPAALAHPGLQAYMASRRS